MIIKSHVRGGYRNAADYFKDQGQNEAVRIVELSDFDAETLDEAFLNMWKVASASQARKPLHHVSINPYKDEHLDDDQMLSVINRCEQKYGYKPHDHQRVIIEHIKDGRQHFHTIWNRVSLATGRPVSPGYDWNKSIKVAREMEIELGLKCPLPMQQIRARMTDSSPLRNAHNIDSRQDKKALDENIPDSEKLAFAKRPDHELMELLAWAWENRRIDILQSFGICLPPDFEF